MGLHLENKVFGKWAAMAAVLDRFAANAVKDYFAQISLDIGAAVRSACSEDNGLASYDGHIYNAYRRIVAAYGEVTEIYLDESRPVTCPALKEIWDGVYAVLASRISFDIDKENPITLENERILSAEIFAAKGQMDNLYAEIVKQHMPDYQILFRRCVLGGMNFEIIKTALSGITNSILQDYGKEFGKIYHLTIGSAVAALNDLGRRPATSHYYELLKEEHDILRQIVVVQIAALEEAARGSDSNEEETAVLEDALSVLREAYQRESAEIARIDKIFAEGFEGNNDVLTYFDLKQLVPFVKDLPEVYQALQQSFDIKYNAFAEHVCNLVVACAEAHGNNTLTKAKHNCGIVAAELVQMAQGICDCFSNIASFYEENKEHLLACDERNIVAGVADTIIIKIESLTEALADFDNTINSVVDKLHPDVTLDKVTLDTFVRYFSEGLVDMCRTERKGAKIVRKLINGGIFGEYSERVDRGIARQIEGFDKKTLAFKRDSLFFELVTFDEIMYYSVSRLRESLDSEILEFVAKIDNQQKLMDDILVKYGVDKIAPIGHELFNPKEHEVLMVEENTDFKKGEIIKTMNAGYRQGGVVVVRANVIAAR